MLPPTSRTVTRSIGARREGSSVLVPPRSGEGFTVGILWFGIALGICCEEARFLCAARRGTSFHVALQTGQTRVAWLRTCAAMQGK
ncbi:hypothetical protein MtrunA17_Chr3g0141071 [Medicago truncatula]|uniref:Uncharacterized protein n=1 Tax=Medicago truncatula TaxID=3880 RepID=A0A396IYX1_MEDTR|nr:hypothetical protein MtrunA17_Chr3g0141071 [Medicago truncatula]